MKRTLILNTGVVVAFVALIAIDVTAEPMRTDRAEPAAVSNVPVDAGGLVFRSSSPRPPVGDGPPIAPVWLYDINAPVLSSPKFADVDGDQLAEVIVTSYDPVNPYSAGRLFVFDRAGAVLPGWPTVSAGPMPASPAIADLDGNGSIELVCGSWQRVYVWNADGTNYPGWPKAVGTYDSPVVADLDGDGDLEIICTDTSKRLQVWHHDGTTLSGWPFTAPELINSPSVADIDHDNQLEIVAGTYAGPVGPNPFQVYAWNVDGTVLPGFPVATSGTVKGAVALGDIDDDGDVEIVAPAYHTSNNDYLYAWDATGALEPGWPIQAPYIRLSSPSLADLDGDGDLEIVIGGLLAVVPWREQVYAYHHDGTAVAGWPVQLVHPGGVGNINSCPVIAHVDGQPAIFTKVTDHVFALLPNGSVAPGFPYFMSDESQTGTYSPSPAVADADGDGDAEYVFVSNHGMVAYFDEPAAIVAGCDWPVFKHDARSQGAYACTTILLGDLNCDGVLDVDDVGPFALALADPAAYAAAFPNCDVRRADMNGDGSANGEDGPLFVAALLAP